jgi:hypothetical protein
VTRRPSYALAALVGASFLIRTALAWLRSAPALFPDEYLYSAIGRSFAESGRPSVRGGSANFPALLQPIVTAPAWLIHDVDTAFRVVQAMGALAMSLAAVPVYLIARRLGLSTRVSLVLAAFTVLVPDLLYASFISSEALAYPLVLASVYTAMRALTTPTRRTQLLFVATAAVTTLARIQFAALPIVFVLAAVVVGARERRVKQAVREQTFPLVLFALGAAAVLASGPARTVGVYRYLFGFHTGPLGILHWAALDAMTLAYAAGWIVVPGAILGLWLSLRRPRSTDELAFGVFVVFLVAALFFEAGLLQASLTLQKEIQERYVFYAAPLLGVCFALYASRGWPLRLPHLALAAALLLVSVQVPLGGYAVASTLDGSPILFGVYWLTGKLGHPGDASAVVAAAVAVMSVIAVVASRRPRLGTPVVLGFALLATGVASAGAVAFDVETTAKVKKAFLPADPSWIDRANVGNVSLLQAFSGPRAASLQQLFWNRSISSVALLPGAAKFDNYPADRVHVSDDGTMTVNGRHLDGPMLVDGFGSTVRLRGAHVLETGPTAALWLPDRGARPQLAFYALGRYHDGWLAGAGAFYAWPEAAGRPVSGWITMRLTAPAAIGAMQLKFELSATRSVRIRLAPGQTRLVRIPLCGGPDAKAHVSYRSNVRAIVGLRIVSAQSTTPVFTPNAAACTPGSFGAA